MALFLTVLVESTVLVVEETTFGRNEAVSFNLNCYLADHRILDLEGVINNGDTESIGFKAGRL